MSLGTRLVSFSCFMLLPPTLGLYRIVLCKCPWALAAHAPIIESGRLHGSTIPPERPTLERPTLDAKFAARGYRMDLHHWFVCASLRLAWQWYHMCYKVDQLVASLPSSSSVQLSLALHKFRAAGEERYEWGYRRVCVNLWHLMLWWPKLIRTIVAMYCKELEVGLTLKRSSQLQCGFIQVQVVVHLLLQGFSVTTLMHWRCLANSELSCKMKFIL